MEQLRSYGHESRESPCSLLHLDVRRLVLRCQSEEPDVQTANSEDPCNRNRAQEQPNVRSTRRQSTEEKDEELLNQRAARFAHTTSDDVDGRLTLCLLLCVERDVRHLLRWIEPKSGPALSANKLLDTR